MGCRISIFMLQWVKTLFAITLEPAAVSRLWDIFFVEGIDFIIKYCFVLLERAKGIYFLNPINIR